MRQCGSRYLRCSTSYAANHAKRLSIVRCRGSRARAQRESVVKSSTVLWMALWCLASQAAAQPPDERMKQLYSCLYDQSCRHTYIPTGIVEQKYYASGPYRVLNHTTEASCDSLGNKCTIYYPDLSTSTLKHPIVTWGNGSNATPESYAYLLTHLASWGFVVIATHEKLVLTNGNGKTLV